MTVRTHSTLLRTSDRVENLLSQGVHSCVFFFWESSWLTFFGVMLHLDLFMTGRLGGTD